MRKTLKFRSAGDFLGLGLALVVLAATVHGGSKPSTPTIAYRLDSTDGLELVDTTAQVVDYRAGERCTSRRDQRNAKVTAAMAGAR